MELSSMLDRALGLVLSLNVFRSLNPFPCRLTPRPHVGKLLDRVLTE